ncbi:MAG: hypothetical protein V3U54_08680 [Thermodesulfobacteriota bacterium]
MEKFDIEKHITEDLYHKPLKEAIKFVKAHGYTIRVVKQWKKGQWNTFIITQDYKRKRINVATDADNKIHHVEGLG